MLNQKNYILDIVDNIISSTHLDTLEDVEKQAFRKSLEAQATKRIGLIIMKNLDKKGLREYEKLIKDIPLDQKKFEKFLTKNLPDYKNIIKQGMDDFIKEVLIAIG